MDGYTSSELLSILAMQGFAGISMFSVLLLMALGLAIIFGQMGVINMAHGEFMTLGAYTTYLLSHIATSYGFLNEYFPLAILAAFAVAFIVGYLVEWSFIRFLYKRPLDTLLATWGLSLILQQIFRSIFGAREVSPDMPDWIMGSFDLTDLIQIPINGVFVLVLSIVVTALVFMFLNKSHWGIQVRATVQNRMMANAVGINTAKIDRLTFAIGCGVAGVAGAAFTTIASTGPTSGSLHIVDTFMVVVLGGAGSLVGTIVSAFTIAETDSIMSFFMSGTIAKVLTLLMVVGVIMAKPEGLFPSKIRK
ncbi:urea ABC transporter permease subunit UrtB [Hydrogenovibrio kuenenii]|uniref:urea ABC transporter permease subunit UrtB n=1 Tax=Hydrogenovibrio kuenenii TaxID=63658 RepID=UPI000465E827|nr:urea ABC transporter permease subunit UrtB [Hydrogenovibrio kuenenii]